MSYKTIKVEIAENLAAEAVRDGFTAEAYCYEEDGIVNANVWIKGKTAEETAARAELIRVRLADEGFFAEVMTEIEDAREATVMAEKAA